jgi:hypothetical protein
MGGVKMSKIYVTTNDKFFLSYDNASIEEIEIGSHPEEIQEWDIQDYFSEIEKIKQAKENN